MKLKLLLVFLMAFSGEMVAQITAMPSPSAGQSTRYSTASVTESSGRITASIPLYTYQAGNLSVPVSLTYVGNGVKVSQPSNWVGTNWILNAGGVVTRTVNDYPDELASVRILAADVEAAAANPDENTPLSPFQTLAESDTRDLRADLFSFSFPGYSGSFYLDDELKPRLTDNNSELRISMTSDLNIAQTWTINIITPDGVSYYFGGLNASEKSSTAINVKKKGMGWMQDPELTSTNFVSALCTTAFYLYKIEGPDHDTIFFEYHEDETRNMIFFEQQRRSAADGIPPPIGEACFDLENYYGEMASVFFGTLYNPKKIKRIYSPNSLFELQFNSELYQLPSDGYIPTPQYDDRILNSVDEVRVYADTTNNFVSKHIALEYLKPTAQNTLKHRFFLDKVSVFQTGQTQGAACEAYKMDYDYPESLPSRFSYKIDMLGYYNGAANLNLIPENSNAIIDNAWEDLALRTSNLDYAKLGSLKKIHNPTGGYTEFEYEAPQVRASVEKSQWLRVSRNMPGEATDLEDSFDIGEPFYIEDSTEPILVISEDQKMTVKIMGNVVSGSPPVPLTVTVTVDDLTDSSLDDSESFQFNHNQLSYDKDFSFSLKKGHKYNIKLTMSYSGSSASAVEIWGRFSFTGYEYLTAQGIRIKRIKDYADGVLAKTVRYHYKRANHVGTFEDDSAVIIYKGDSDEKIEAYGCQLEDGTESFQIASLMTNPFGSIFSGSDNQVEYRYVTLSYGGDNFEEGGVEKHFKVDNKEETTVISPIIPSNNPERQQAYREQIDFGSSNLNNADMFNGTLLGQRSIERKGLALFVSSETDYEYQRTIDHEQKSVIISMRLLEDHPELNPPTGTYKNQSFRFNLMSTTTTTYPDPYPLSLTGSAPNGITSSTKYTYGALRGLPVSVISKNSNGKNRIQKSYYPVTADINAMTSVSSQDIANYELLEDQNIISSPIQTESYIQDNDSATPVLLSRARTLFTQVGSSPVMVLPLSKKSAKANGTLVGFGSISQYDASGRPLQITEPNGLVRSVVYGYSGDTVIAELSNINYNDLSPTLISDLQVASKNITDAASLAAFETLLNTLRTDPAYAAAMVTTYVYGKDGRLLSVTDARGRKASKQYDECGRVKFTLDHDGNVIEETNYNIKN